MTIYSQSKAVFHVDRLEDLRRTGNTEPVHVQMILSDLCNQDCSFCAYRMSAGLSKELFATPSTHNPNRKIPTDKALEIIDDCAELGVKAIQFTGGGEPTVHRDHLKIFAHAQGYGIETALVTNGIKLVPVPEIMKMKWVRISVDAGRESTYTQVRRVSKMHWRKVWINIEKMVEHKFPGRLGVGFVVTPENYEDIVQATWIARKAGVHNIRIGAVFSKEGLAFYPEEIIPKIVHNIKMAKRLQSPEFEVLDLFGRRMGDLEGGRPTDRFCGYQYFTTYIGGDLNVYRCCNTAYTELGKIGNLNGERFADLMARHPHAGFDATRCQFCQFRGQNEIINDMLKPPDHENFV